MTGTSWADEGAKTVMPGILQAQRHVEHAVVAGAVRAGDAGPVQGEDDRQAVQAHIQVGLVEGPAEERGVDGDHRPQAAHRHARRGRHCGLLGDADVEEAVRPAVCEGQQPGRRRAWRR